MYKKYQDVRLIIKHLITQKTLSLLDKLPPNSVHLGSKDMSNVMVKWGPTL